MSQDAEPQQDNEEEVAATDIVRGDPSARFRLIVAVAITVVSVLGAVVAWSASATSNRAGDLNQAAQQEFLLHEQILTSARASVGEDLRRVADLQEELVAERVLRSQADRLRAKQPDVAAVLDAQAQGQAALARTTSAAFFATAPSVEPDGTVHYDEEQAMRNLLGQYVVFGQLHPEQTQAAANRAVREYRELIAIGVLFVTALFFFTIAEFGRFHLRNAAVVLGSLALVAGCVLWPLADRGSL